MLHDIARDAHLRWTAVALLFGLLGPACSKAPVAGRGEPPAQRESGTPAARHAPAAQTEIVGPVREPMVAGRFYADSPAELRRQVAGYVAAARKENLPGRVIAIIAPHAGYSFSGPTAGRAYRHLEGEAIDTAIVVGSHMPLRYAAVYASGGYRTPLGVAAVDRDLAGALVAANDSLTDAPAAHSAGDNALEVQIPFVQVALPGARIVPVSFNVEDPSSQADRGLARRVGEGIAGAMRGRNAVIVCSTDLSHYPDAATAEASDRAILDAICSLDADRIASTNVELLEKYRGHNLSCTACGLGAVLATVEAARLLGATGARLVGYTHSDDTGRGVVGYGAVVIYGPPDSRRAAAAAEATTPSGRMLSDDERKELLHLARTSVELYFDGRPAPRPAKLTEALSMKSGAFVTLTERGELRGCIGTFDRSMPLWRVVADRARSAAFADTRFRPVGREELDDIRFEISVLSPYRKLDDPLSIRLGVDGILVEGRGGRGGTFLPQVATETGWSKEEFLSNCCAHKAGLAPGAWRDPEQVAVYAYTAEVFSEADPADGPHQ